jgi:hypothetical protein
MDKLDPDRAKPVPMTERQRRLWDALNDFIRSQGAWLVSAPHEKWLRVECECGSPLPVKLSQMGYSDVRAAGVSTRVTSNGLIPTEFVSFTLPK